MAAEQLVQKPGEMATFVIHVEYRQYSTWQGEIVWAEQNKKSCFRSALEMLKLMDSVWDDAEERGS